MCKKLSLCLCLASVALTTVAVAVVLASQPANSIGDPWSPDRPTAIGGSGNTPDEWLPLSNSDSENHPCYFYWYDGSTQKTCNLTESTAWTSSGYPTLIEWTGRIYEWSDGNALTGLVYSGEETEAYWNVTVWRSIGYVGSVWVCRPNRVIITAYDLDDHVLGQREFSADDANASDFSGLACVSSEWAVDEGAGYVFGVYMIGWHQ